MDFSIETTLMDLAVNASSNISTEINFENKHEVSPLPLVILSILYGSISIFAVVGNSLVIWIIGTSKRMQNVTNIFIGNLALADIVIGLFSIPFRFQGALLQRWDLPYFMCPFSPFVQILSVNVSIFTLTAIALDRHRAILKPLSVKPTKRTAKLVIATIWIISGILATPVAIAHRVMEAKNKNPDPRNPDDFKSICMYVNLSQNAMLIYGAVLAFLQYLMPLSIISCVYARVALKLWGSTAPGNAEDSRDANMIKNKIKVIKMLITVVVLFGLCWLPFHIYFVLQFMYPEINQYEHIHYIFFCIDWLAMSNSSVNPVIYGIYTDNFRREFRQRSPFKWRKSTTNPPIDTTEMNKTQSSRTSIRFEWKRPNSGNYPTVTSFQKGVQIKGSNNSFIDDHEACTRSDRIGHYADNIEENHCTSSSNKSEELYVFVPESEQSPRRIK
ncbi:RYamide receptor-like isoform X1 [Hylaeus volcanicus]|uniref:RYamide receptor-like isoform X1 n=3 Tax=Hylaeus volcanicus TaxID=313075 RepID=UPI0023B7D71D|nr:RYamide receptor-like isoform X1 [Hylaeus volcanicus]